MYKLHVDIMTSTQVCVELLGANLIIPFDPANTDYQAYLAWLEQGNEPLPAEVSNGN